MPRLHQGEEELMLKELQAVKRIADAEGAEIDPEHIRSKIPGGCPLCHGSRRTWMPGHDMTVECPACKGRPLPEEGEGRP